MRTLSILGLLLFLHLKPAIAQPPIALKAEACFSGMSPHGVYPTLVTIQNLGVSMDGVIEVGNQSGGWTTTQILYPISLPSGTLKRLIVYPTVTPYQGTVSLRFIGPLRTKPVELNIKSESSLGNIGLIGEDTGGLALLRNQSGDPKEPLTDCYSLPENAPDRTIGYQGLQTLILGSGAERMNGAQWNAIRQWVIAGGSLVLLGGASVPYTQVPDAQPLLPLQNFTAVAASSLAIPIPDVAPFSVGRTALFTGTERPGAATLATHKGRPLLASRPLGTGMVIYAAFNPLEAPLRGSKRIGELWNHLLRIAAPTMHTQSSDTYRYSSRYLKYPGSTSSSNNSVKDPFKIKLPPLQSIVQYFLAYLILVVPVSYFVLRRLKKLEWNWITAPLLSVLFAYALSLSTSSLYGSGLSRRTFGTLIAHAGNQQGQFVGQTELFLPKAGDYPIDVPEADHLELTDITGYASVGSSSGERLTVVDTGTETIPHFVVPNLAFRRIYHTQPVALHGTITGILRIEAGGRLVGTIHNGTAWKLEDVHIRTVGKKTLAIPTLNPNETKSLANAKPLNEAPTSKDTEGSDTPATLYLKSQQKACAFLEANLTGEPFGPALGHYVGSPTTVRLVISLPLTGVQK